MLRRRPKQLICAEVTTTTATLTQRYTVPSGTTTTISAATACNKSGSTATISISMIPVEDTFIRLVWTLSIPANTSRVLPSLVGQTLQAGMTVYADTSANASIDLVISGYEESEA